MAAMALAGRMGSWTERTIVAAALGTMALLPLVEMAGRKAFSVGVPGSILIVQQLTLVVTFLGAALAARRGTLLALSTATFLPARLKEPTSIVVSGIGGGIAAALCLASIDLMRAEFQGGRSLALGVPSWVVIAVMPLGYGLIAGRIVLSDRKHLAWRALAAIVPALMLVVAARHLDWGPRLTVPGLGVVLMATAFGLPVFAALGGAALLLFLGSGSPAASVPVNTYALTAFPVLPAVPLFTLAGAILGAGRANERLVRMLGALVGWMPGGIAVAATLAFAFFTSFTGASGVTILSLGAVMVPVLTKAGYPASFAIGLVTVAGSIGLLLPPSLPIILYGVYAQQRIDHLLVGGIVPGTLFVLLVAALSIHEGNRSGVSRQRFEWREAVAAVREAKWELGLPVIVLGALVGGLATMVEAAALTACYALGVEVFVHRDVSIRRDVPRVLSDSAALVGGFLVIMGVALAVTDYLSFENVPARALDLVQAHITSPLVFLLALNLFLLVVGALMDIYSAIFVIVPLVAPMAAAYGIHPVHLGIVFLANLELGYLTPPMGENLFLSAYRFDRPVMHVFRCSWPFYLVLAGGVIVITYVPALTLGPVSWLSR